MASTYHFIDKYQWFDHLFSFVTNIIIRKELKKVKPGKILLDDTGSAYIIESVIKQGKWKCTEVAVKRPFSATAYKKISLGYVNFKIYDYFEPNFQLDQTVFYNGISYKIDHGWLFAIKSGKNDYILKYHYFIYQTRQRRGISNIPEEELYIPQYNMYWEMLNETEV